MSKMILIEEAKLTSVLEALEMVNRTDLSQVNLAIAAIKEAQADQAQQKPFGYIKPGEGDYEKVFSFNRNERTGYTQAVYTTPQAQPAREPTIYVDPDAIRILLDPDHSGVVTAQLTRHKPDPLRGPKVGLSITKGNT